MNINIKSNKDGTLFSTQTNQPTSNIEDVSNQVLNENSETQGLGDIMDTASEIRGVYI